MVGTKDTRAGTLLCYKVQVPFSRKSLPAVKALDIAKRSGCLVIGMDFWNHSADTFMFLYSE